MKIVLELVLFVAPKQNVALCYTHKMFIKFSELNLKKEMQRIILTW